MIMRCVRDRGTNPYYCSFSAECWSFLKALVPSAIQHAKVIQADIAKLLISMTIRREKEATESTK